MVVGAVMKAEDGDGGSEDGGGGAAGGGDGRTAGGFGGGVLFAEDGSADGAERVATRVAGGGEEGGEAHTLQGLEACSMKARDRAAAAEGGKGWWEAAMVVLTIGVVEAFFDEL